MDLPEFRFNADATAMKFVVSVINQARMRYGDRMNLFQIAESYHVGIPMFVNPSTLKPPLAITSETLIKEAIENVWRLAKIFAYHIKYLERTTNEFTQFYYYEAIFSQPSATYPVPQATASVFFRVEDRLLEPQDHKPPPSMVFRVEGHQNSHDIRYVKLIPDWISEVLMSKIKLSRRIQKIGLF